MDDAPRSRALLEAEVAALRRRVADLERERETTAAVLHGDPGRRETPLLQQVPAMVWLLDRELRLQWWTGGAIRSLGLDPMDLLGTDLYDYLGTRDLSAPPIAAHRVALGGGTASYEMETEGVIFSAHVGPHRDSAGKICGVIGVAIEITERVRAERELRAALDRVRTLSGMIPICMHCKSVRNDEGFWEQVETFVRDHSDARFSHAICPDCMKQALDGGEAGS
jgi:PAS domain S-box-containing protein